MKAERLRTIYDRLLAQHGPQGWWPGETAFEVMVGAILTQNTAWSNVEKAINNLKAADKLSPQRITRCRMATLAKLLRPSGYFNVKAARLREFCHWYLRQGGFEALQRMPTDELRSTLLGIKGIGPETADDMLLYAFDRAVFVVDAYTRRLFSRLGVLRGGEHYETIRLSVEHAMKAEAILYNEYHALVVVHAKNVCKVKPCCDDCYLRNKCPSVD